MIDLTAELTPDQKAKLINHCLCTLREVWPCVQILASGENDKGTTEYCFQGAGNWYARTGMAHEFLERDQASTNAGEIAKKITTRPANKDGDDWKES